MLGLRRITPKISYTTKKLIKQTVKQFHDSGYQGVVAKVNKKGTAAVCGYNNSTREQLLISKAIFPDGKQILKTYDPKKNSFKPYQRIIETWEQIKSGNIFKQRTTIYYKGSNIPRTISTMKLDEGCDGVEIITTHPFEKYAKHFKKNNS